MNAVGAVGPPVHDLVEEDDLLAPLPHRDTLVLGARERLAERDELVVVGREERATPDFLGEVLGDGPGDREAVVRRGAAADLVQSNT